MVDDERAAAERDDARRWAVRLEGELAAALEAVTRELTGRVEALAERDAAIQHWSSATSEAGAYHQQRNEVIAALAALLGVVEALAATNPDGTTMDTIVGIAALTAPALKAREIVGIYRPVPASARAE